MPLSLPSMNVAIVCDGKELETYDVKQEAFIASEAGKGTNRFAMQQFKITFSNNLTNFDFIVLLYIGVRLIRHGHLRAGSSCNFSGLYNISLLTAIAVYARGSILRTHLGAQQETPETRCPSDHATLEPKLTIMTTRRDRRMRLPIFIVPEVSLPFFSGALAHTLPRAIESAGHNHGERREQAGIPINNKERARDDGSPCPSRSRPKIKRESTHRGRTRAVNADSSGQSGEGVVCFLRVAPDGACIQAELDALKAAEQSDTSVKRNLRSPSPIVVKHSEEIVDLTLDD
ncbi:hypothetical protein BJY52DRAFT_1220628 [Lactarius psammicola]|nr:hypothetical protein BJY52DRAFT_1220628 [Lactarius psammicola]